MMCRLSRGRSRRRRHGPLITGCLGAGASDVVVIDAISLSFELEGAWVEGPDFALAVVLGAVLSCDGFLDAGLEAASASRAAVFGISFSDLDMPPPGLSPLRISVPGDGGDANNLYELSVILGIFQGNLRNDMQQNMIANDQISVG